MSGAGVRTDCVQRAHTGSETGLASCHNSQNHLLCDLEKYHNLTEAGFPSRCGACTEDSSLGHALGVFTGDAKWREMTKEQRNKLQRGECTHTGCPGSCGDQERVFWRRRQRSQAAKGKEELASDGSEERAESSRQEE